MVDYNVNYEIVASLDDLPIVGDDWSLRDYREYRDVSVSTLTFDYVYSRRGYWGMYSGVMQNGNGYMVCRSAWVRDSSTNKAYSYPDNGTYASKYVELYGTSQLPIYTLQLINWNGMEVNAFTIAYCAVYGTGWTPDQVSTWELDHVASNCIFNLISDSDRQLLGLPVTTDWNADMLLSHNPLTESVFWLHDLGTYVRNFMFLPNILSFQIGGMSLLSILISAGFLIYMSWVLFKWVIPL